MAQKVLSEEQMREYVEQEVRKALMNENKGKTILQESIDEVLAENMADEGFMDWIGNLFGGQGGSGKGFQAEAIVGAILGRLASPLLRNLLKRLGVDADGELGRAITNALSMTLGGIAGQKVGERWNPIDMSRLIGGGQPQQA